MNSARIQLNRLIMAIVLPIALIHVAIAGRHGIGSGGRVVRRWVARVARLTGLRMEAVGEMPPPGRPQIFVANHSSPLDIPALLAAHPTVRFAAAADLFMVPLLAGAMRAIGSLPVDRRSGDGSHLTAPSLAEDRAAPLVVFPEGGIAPRGRRLEFHRSAFALAIDAGADIVPVAIHHSSRSLPPRGRLGVRPGVVTVEFLPLLPTAGLTQADRFDLCDRARQSICEVLGAEDGGLRSASTAPTQP